MSRAAIICVTPTDVVSQYTTMCVARAIDGKATQGPDADKVWREAELAAQKAEEELE